MLDTEPRAPGAETAPAGRGSPAAGAGPGMLAVVCWSLFATTFVLEAVSVVRADRAWLVSRLPDDAFYYLEIGQRLSRGEGFTFDGVHATNGFHPLWQLMVAGLATAFSGDVLVKAAMLSGLVLLAMALVLVYRALVPVIGPTWSALAVTVAARPQGTLMNGVNGMEGALVAFTLALMVVALRRAVMLPGATRSAVLGVAAGLVVLSRLDFGVVILPVVLVVAVRAGVRQAGVAAAALGATCGPWLLYSLVSFGSPLPVSGYIKLRGEESAVAHLYGGWLTPTYLHSVEEHVRLYLIVLSHDAALSRHPATASLLVVAGLAGAVVWIMRNRRRSKLSPSALALVLVGITVTLKAGIDVATLPSWALRWYSVPSRLTFEILLVLGVGELTRAVLAAGRVPVSEPGARWAVVVLATALVIGPALIPNDSDARTAPTMAAPPGNWQDANVLAATWLRTHPLPGTYGSTDAGLLGFDLDPRPVVDLDGLVNTYAYASLVTRGAPALERARTEGVRYLIERGTPGDDLVPSCAATLWQSPWPIAYDSPPSDVRLGIYDLAPCGSS